MRTLLLITLAALGCSHAPAPNANTSYVLVEERSRAYALADPQLIRTVEERLAVKGAPTLVAFQQAHGLRPTGLLDKATARALGIRWGLVQAQLTADRVTPTL
jgi:Putative peptidoglycan binding domain